MKNSEVIEMLKEMQERTAHTMGFFVGHVTHAWVINSLLGSKIAELEKVVDEDDNEAPVLPCEVGDKVYEIGVEENSIEEKQVENIFFQEQKVIIYAKEDSNAFSVYKVSDFGNSVFCTKQEAEMALGSIQRRN